LDFGSIGLIQPGFFRSLLAGEGKKIYFPCFTACMDWSTGGVYPFALIGKRTAQSKFGLEGGRSLVVLNIRRDVIERGGTRKRGI
jgi:hypothetical protein